MRDFKKLKIWKKSHDLTLELYHKTNCFPKDELYGLSSQIRRAASSIPANIAEGSGRETIKELIRYIIIARGSAFELEYFIILSHDLKLIDHDTFQDLNLKIIELKKMLSGYARKMSESADH